MRQSDALADEYGVQGVVRTKARIINTTTTRSGLGVALWERQGGGEIRFKPDHHTFSLYLAGGRQVRPVEGESLGRSTGSPGAICLMPEGTETAWDNRGYVRLMHVYFRSDHLEHATDGRAPDLATATFGRDPMARSLMEQFVLGLDWSDNASSMAVEYGVYALLARIASLDKKVQNTRSRGGLTSSQHQRARELVENRLGERITVTEMADAAGLSVRQFSRAFIQSEGVPPYEWVLSRRVEIAKKRLERGDKAAVVALDCGFSSQTHMSRHFRARLGVTPSRLVKDR